MDYRVIWTTLDYGETRHSLRMNHCGAPNQEVSTPKFSHRISDAHRKTQDIAGGSQQKVDDGFDLTKYDPQLHSSVVLMPADAEDEKRGCSANRILLKALCPHSTDSRQRRKVWPRACTSYLVSVRLFQV
uniref:Neprosin activation peptide domain-containing protein n=1 Tax=Setaria digitata TaxID=48799 RepID=A0A915PXA6_9BILA